MREKLLQRMRIAILLVCALLTAGCMGSRAYAFEGNAQDGTVAVVFYLKGAFTFITDGQQFVTVRELGDMESSSGSGFFIGASGEDPQYIVTNCHVVSNYISANEGGVFVEDIGQYQGYPLCLGAESCELRVYYDNDDYDVAYVEAYGDVDKVDLAVLRIKEPTDKRCALQFLIPTEDMRGDTVYTIGYPGNADNDFSSASRYGIKDSTVHRGVINRFVVNEGKGVERIAIDATIQHGNSGGPLVTEEGYVIGVNTNVHATSPYENQIEEDYYAINASEVTHFLDRNNIGYEMAGKGGSLGIVWIIIGVAVVVVVAAVIVALVLKKSKKGAGAKGPKPVQKGGTTAFVRSMSSQHGSREFPVGSSPILIGRNPAECTIVFQEGTRGVSGKHCSVYYKADANVFTLTDLGSTYGTFLGNGMRLTANSPINLKPGDIFYIGEKTNVLKVETRQ